MSRTYRALAIVAVVAIVATVASEFAFSQALNYSLAGGGWFTYAPINGPLHDVIPGLFILPFWSATSSLGTPIVATFSVVVAAQARRWGWLCVFVLLGLVSVYGPEMLFILERYTGFARLLHAIGLDASIQLLPLALLFAAALIFVASARRRTPDANLERTALPQV